MVTAPQAGSIGIALTNDSLWLAVELPAREVGARFVRA